MCYLKSYLQEIIKFECQNLKVIIEERRKLEANDIPTTDFVMINELYFRGKLMLEKVNCHKHEILREFQSSLYGGHSGVEWTFKCI